MKKLLILAVFFTGLLQGCRGQGRHLAVGDVMPPFSLTNQDGKMFNSTDYVGKKILVVYFYPKDESSVCTKEACAFRDNYGAFTKAGAVVAGINDAPVETHQKFGANHQLPFFVLSDPGNKVLKQFGVGKFIITGRETFVVGLDGKIAYTYNAMLQGSKHAEQALKFVQSMKR